MYGWYFEVHRFRRNGTIELIEKIFPSSSSYADDISAIVYTTIITANTADNVRKNILDFHQCISNQTQLVVERDMNCIYQC